MSELSNPVVFFTLGQDFPVSDTLEAYVKGAGFINVPKDFSEDYIKEEIGRVWQGFLKTNVGKADILRANFFIFSDETAFALPNLIITAEKYFTALYPAGVLFDIFCFTDETDLLKNTECRKDVLLMLREMQGEGLRVYLLSNLTSANSFVSQENLAHTVSLLTLFKNCSPNLSVTEADASRYNEFFFLENCATRRGGFLTAGSVVLSVPQEALKALIAAEILRFGCDEISDSAPALKEPSFPPKPPTKSMDYLCGIAIPEYNINDSLTRGQWISRLFGQRLTQIIENHNDTPLETDEDIFPKTTSLYELLQHTSENGAFGKTINAALQTATDDLHTISEKCKMWLEKTPIIKKGNPEAATRRLSVLQSQHLFPYVLASEYLRRQNEIAHTQEKIEILKRRQRLVSKFHKKLQRYNEEVKSAIFPEKISELNTTFHTFTERRSKTAEDYFREKFHQYAAAHKPEIKQLSQEMTESLLAGEFSSFKARLLSHIEKTILPAPEFNQPIMTLLQELSGGEEITALSEWVLQNKHIGVRLKTTTLYSEANLLMPAHTASEVKKSYESRGLGRVNLFADKMANRVAVLYHAGAFDMEEFYYL